VLDYRDGRDKPGRDQVGTATSFALVPLRPQLTQPQGECTAQVSMKTIERAPLARNSRPPSPSIGATILRSCRAVLAERSRSQRHSSENIKHKLYYYDNDI